MDNLMELINDILKNRVEDVNYDEGEGKIPFSPMSHLLDTIGISFQMKEEEQIMQELKKIKEKNKRPSALLGAFLSCVAGMIFYYVWLKMFLKMDNTVMEVLLTLTFSDVVYAIYRYTSRKSSLEQIRFILGEYQIRPDGNLFDNNDMVFKRLHIPLPDAKMESYQSICKLLKNKHIEFPTELKDVREEINYLKQRVADGVFEIRQDEVCILCTQNKK